MENGSLMQTFLNTGSPAFDARGLRVSLGPIRRSVKPVYVQPEMLFSSKNIIMQIAISKYTPRLEYLFS